MGNAISLAESQHLIRAPAGKVPIMPETEPCPNLADTTGNQICVFVQISGGAECPNFLRVIKALQIEHLAASDFVEHRANVAVICLLQLIEPIKASGQRLKQLSFALVRL